MTGAPRDGATPLRLRVSSFGFKYGPQPDADWVIDARVLDNPFWVAELRPFTGLEEPVRRFVLDNPDTVAFLERLTSLLRWTAQRAHGRGRESLEVAVGCTGGRHRSVVVATELGQRLASSEVAVTVCHRDVERPDPR
ncbi:MAG: RapZ C-terminal domain-containing protein [Candidatus Dormibacteria bacterium]